MKNEKIAVGNKCYLLVQGNNARYYNNKPIEEWIHEGEIVKVGTKYFTVKTKKNEIQFIIDTLEEKTIFCSDWKFHFTKEEIIVRDELNKNECN